MACTPRELLTEDSPWCRAAKQGAEELLLQRAKALGLSLKWFDMGKVAAAELVSRQQADGFSALPLLDPDQVPTPLAADTGSEEERQAFHEGFYRTLELAILAASSVETHFLHRESAHFLHIPARANGFCLFDAVSISVGGTAEEWREQVVKALCKEWGDACSAGLGLAGHTGRTVGEALAAEHGKAFSGPEQYAAHMTTRNGKDEVPQGTVVEAERLANLVKRAVWILTRERDGGVSHSMLFLPGVISGDTVFLLHGMRGTGGEHFDALIVEESSEDTADELDLDVLRMSESAWHSCRRLAMGACLARLWSLDALNLASTALGGAEQLLEACREAVGEAGALQANHLGEPGPDALRAAAWQLAAEATEADQLARLLGCTALLRSALKDRLVEQAGLKTSAEVHEVEAGNACLRVIKVQGRRNLFASGRAPLLHTKCWLLGLKSFVFQASAVTEGPTARTHARTRTHQGVYATRPLRELVLQHVPCTLADAAECVRRLAVEVPRLQNQAAALAPTDGTCTPSAAAVLDEVIGGGGGGGAKPSRAAVRSGHALGIRI